MSDDSVVGFGLSVQQEANNSKELSSCGAKKSILMSNYYLNDQDSSSCGSSGGVGGSMFCTRNNAMSPVVSGSGDIYDVVGNSVAMTKSLQPFNSVSSFAFNSTGGTPSVNVNVRVPFTASQKQEFDRQTMVFKCMMNSIPVPPELLVPINRTQPNSPISQSNTMLRSALELGISGCNSDPEPWRCKRTDGKKWRCSRDVAPDQKYCERHSHKSRPRSRKPVEIHTDSMTGNNNYASNVPLPIQKNQFPSQSNYHFSMFPSTMPSAAPSYEQPRSLEWFLKGETGSVAGNSNLEWQHLGRDSSKCDDKDYDIHALYKPEEHRLNPNSIMNLGGSSHAMEAQGLNDHCNLLLSSRTTPLEVALSRGPTPAQETRHFLDMWSTAVRDNIDAGIGDKSPVGSSSERILPLSSLTLSMSGGSETDEDNESGQMASTDLRSHWMSHGGSWTNSPPGGPLAEALCLGISSSPKSSSSLASPHGSSCDNTLNRS